MYLLMVNPILRDIWILSLLLTSPVKELKINWLKLYFPIVIGKYLS